MWAAGERRQLALVDLGASAGLNLVADGLAPLWTDDGDRPMPIAPRSPVALRLGLDLNPLDVTRGDDANWLRACVWPSDRQRIDRLEQAIARFRDSAPGEAPVLEACALPDAPARLARLPPDMFVLAMQSIVRDYLDPAGREAYEMGMRNFISSRPRAAIHAELELASHDSGVEGPRGNSAALTLRVANGDGALREFVVAHTHPHPRRLVCDHRAVEAFVAAIQAAAL